MPQEKISRYLVMKRPNYTNLEIGKLKPSSLQIHRLSFFYGIESEWLSGHKFEKVFKNKVNLFFIPTSDISLREKNFSYITLQNLMPSFLIDTRIKKIFSFKENEIIMYHFETDQILILKVSKYLFEILSKIHAGKFKEKNKTIEGLNLEIKTPILDSFFSFLPSSVLREMLKKAKFQENNINKFINNYDKTINDELFERTKIFRDLLWGFRLGLRQEWEFNCKIRVKSVYGLTEFDAFHELLSLEDYYKKQGNRINIFPKPRP